MPSTQPLVQTPHFTVFGSQLLARLELLRSVWLSPEQKLRLEW